LEPARRVLDRLSIPVLLERVLPCLVVVLRGPIEMLAVLEVHRQLARNPLRPRAIATLETLGRPQVQSDPQTDGDAPVEHLLVQGVNEGIPPGDGAIRPLGDADLAEELAPSCQRLASQLALLRIDPRRDD